MVHLWSKMKVRRGQTEGENWINSTINQLLHESSFCSFVSFSHAAAVVKEKHD